MSGTESFKIECQLMCDAIRTGRPDTSLQRTSNPRESTGDNRRSGCRIEHHIIHDELQYHKISARCVSKQLTPELKEQRMDICETLMRRYETKGDGFLKRIVTGDEC